MILDKLKRGKKKEKGPAISRSEFLEITPFRNPKVKWEKDEEEKISVFIPLEQTETRKKGILSRLMPPPPKEKEIRLDVVGSIVWELCDGKRTVKEIVEYLHEEYKMMQNEAEVSLNQYFNTLSKRGLVGFILPEETRARLEEAAKKEKEKK